MQESSHASAYAITQLSRHPQRPYTLDIISGICKDFLELHGDRNFMDDAALVTGIGLLQSGIRVAVIGHQKGRSTKENMKRNFGMPRPEGYRKALRIMELAQRFGLPIITLIDTPGAYPGIDAEERGQSEAIAKNIMVMSRLEVPIVSVVIGEGGSGGALAIGVANRVYMMENATYSVISPEGCASILWKDGSRAAQAADLLGLTAPIAHKLGLIDGIIPEPDGGAHTNHAAAIASISDFISNALEELIPFSGSQLKQQRTAKFEAMGPVVDKGVQDGMGFMSTATPAWPVEWEMSWDEVQKNLNGI